MTPEEQQKLKKQEFLAEVLHRCLYKDPRLSLKELAEVIAEEIEDIELFLRQYNKEKNK